MKKPVRRTRNLVDGDGRLIAASIAVGLVLLFLLISNVQLWHMTSRLDDRTASSEQLEGAEVTSLPPLPETSDRGDDLLREIARAERGMRKSIEGLGATSAAAGGNAQAAILSNRLRDVAQALDEIDMGARSDEAPDLTRLTKRVRELSKRLASLRPAGSALHDLNDQSKDMKHQTDALLLETRSMGDEMGSLGERIDLLSSDMGLLSGDMGLLSGDLGALQRQIDDLGGDLNALRGTVDGLDLRLRTTSDMLAIFSELVCEGVAEEDRPESCPPSP